MPLNKFIHHIEEHNKITTVQLQIKSDNESHKTRANLIIKLSFIITFFYKTTAHNLRLQSNFQLSQSVQHGNYNRSIYSWQQALVLCFISSNNFMKITMCAKRNSKC